MKNEICIIKIVALKVTLKSVNLFFYHVLKPLSGALKRYQRKS